MKRIHYLRGLVLFWTILTTTFFWTSAMRILFKPEISEWSIFNLGGKGLSGDYWFLFLVIIYALLLIYIESRGRKRILYHIFLLTWHLVITAAIFYGSFQTDSKVAFGAWGIDMSFNWLTIPFLLFLVLVCLLIVQERSGKFNIPKIPWSNLNWKLLPIVLLLVPVAILFFYLGTGFNWLVKIAIVATIIQWILLTEIFGRPNKLRSHE